MGIEKPSPQKCNTTCRRSGWQWADGTTYNFTNWKGEEPDGRESCARLVEGGWAGFGCEANYGYICEKGKTFAV